MKILDRTELYQSQFLFAAACAASRAHSKLAADALAAWGEHGPQISGVVRDHFPEPVKGALRDLAALVTNESKAAYNARPKRVKMATMRTLAQAVARRDGSGFYGPRSA